MWKATKVYDRKGPLSAEIDPGLTFDKASARCAVYARVLSFGRLPSASAPQSLPAAPGGQGSASEVKADRPSRTDVDEKQLRRFAGVSAMTPGKARGLGTPRPQSLTRSPIGGN